MKQRTIEPGDIVRFRKVKKTRLSSIDSWIDADENFIPPGSLGLVLSKSWVAHEDDADWEYDISIPELGIISCGWGDYAFAVISTPCKNH